MHVDIRLYKQKSAVLLLDKLSSKLTHFLPGGGGPGPTARKQRVNVYFSPQLILQFYSGVYQWFISKL